MADDPGRRGTELEHIAAALKVRLENERAAGAYADDLSGFELQTPGEDAGPRVRLRPELGFSSKPVIGPMITQVKRLVLRLQFHVLDDLARQTDAAITRLDRALAVEIATRERLERELDDKLRLHEDKDGSDGDAAPGRQPRAR
jgi:hypothetical protein